MIEPRQKVGNYEIKEVLGEGGMGVVYLAEHPDIGRRVAIKLLRRAVLDEERTVRRFRDEARLLVKLRHPNIVEMSDFGRTPKGQPYYVMELLEGRHLRHLLNQDGPLTPGEALPLLEQICSALSAAHRMGVVHRDLKPDNIFITEVGGEPLVKLLDFGLARLWEPLGDPSLTRTGDLLGSPITISPEQAAGQSKRVNRRSDLYSLGVILFWMLAGEPPFIARQPGKLISMHLNHPAPDLQERAPEVPRQVAAVVARCMRKKPEERPASAESLLHGYVRALEGHDPWPPGQEERGATVVGYANPVVRMQDRPQGPAGAVGQTLQRMVNHPLRLAWLLLPLLLFGGLITLTLLHRAGPKPSAPVVATPPPDAGAPPPDLRPAPDLTAPDLQAMPDQPRRPDLPPRAKRPVPRPRVKRRQPPPEKRERVLGEGVVEF